MDKNIDPAEVCTSTVFVPLISAGYGCCGRILENGCTGPSHSTEIHLQRRSHGGLSLSAAGEDFQLFAVLPRQKVNIKPYVTFAQRQKMYIMKNPQLQRKGWIVRPWFLVYSSTNPRNYYIPAQKMFCL